MRYVARLGELHDPIGVETLLAEDDDGQRVGVLTYHVVGTDCEVTPLYTRQAGRMTHTHPTNRRGARRRTRANLDHDTQPTC